MNNSPVGYAIFSMENPSVATTNILDVFKVYNTHKHKNFNFYKSDNSPKPFQAETVV